MTIGVLTQAQKASTKTNEKSAIEEVELAYASLFAEYLEATGQNANEPKSSHINKPGFVRELTGIGSVGDDYAENAGVITFTYSSNGKNADYLMTIDASGKVSAAMVTGSGSGNQSGNEPGGGNEPATTHTVTYYSDNLKSSVLATDSTVTDGEPSSYTGDTPTKAEDSTNTYTFAGWYLIGGTTDADLTHVTTDMEVYPKFTATAKATGTINASNWINYLGQKVAYTPDWSKNGYTGTVPNYGTGKVTSTSAPTYRLFYFDESTNRVYLKADYDGNNSVNLSTLTSSWESSESSSFNTLISLNNIGSANTIGLSDIITITNAGQANESWTYTGNGRKGAAYMADPAVWTDWKDSSITDTSMYVIGGPTLGMYVASYNEFMTKYNKNGVTLKYSTTGNAATLSCQWKSGGPGYQIKLGTGNYDNWAYVTNGSNSAYPPTTGGTEEANAAATALQNEIKAVAKMYDPESGYYWLASPSAYGGSYVVRVNGGNSNVSYNHSDTNAGVCPLVSLSSSVNLTMQGY